MGKYRVQVKHHVGQPDVAEISDLLLLAAVADDHRPLGEPKWLELVHGGGRGFVGLLAHEVDDAVLVGYAQLTLERDAWGLEVVVHPAQRGAGERLGFSLLVAAVEEVRRQGGGRVRYWAAKPTPHHDADAVALGFVSERDLLQLRTPLPLPPEMRRGVAPVSVRPFRPGHDEDAWLAVNNRAFADHPEQGGWELATLSEREAEPWFDPQGFLLHEEDGRLAGSCWTKVHRDGPTVLGEIYVISVDPDAGGRGLGRALVVAGLDHLAVEGITTGMLYTDATNLPALHLYGSLGFTLDHVDRAYVLDVAPGAARDLNGDSDRDRDGDRERQG